MNLPGKLAIGALAIGAVTSFAWAHENEHPGDLRPGAHSREDFEAHLAGRECPGPGGHQDQDLSGSPAGRDPTHLPSGRADHDEGRFAKELGNTAVQRGKDCLKGAAVGVGAMVPAGVGAKVAGKTMTTPMVVGAAATGCVGNTIKEGFKEFEQLGGWDALTRDTKDFVDTRFRRCAAEQGVPNTKYSDQPQL